MLLLGTTPAPANTTQELLALIPALGLPPPAAAPSAHGHGKGSGRRPQSHYGVAAGTSVLVVSQPLEPLRTRPDSGGSDYTYHTARRTLRVRVGAVDVVGGWVGGWVVCACVMPVLGTSHLCVMGYSSGRCQRGCQSQAERRERIGMCVRRPLLCCRDTGMLPASTPQQH